jgi:hypothetical protein
LAPGIAQSLGVCCTLAVKPLARHETGLALALKKFVYNSCHVRFASSISTILIYHHRLPLDGCACPTREYVKRNQSFWVLV